jgi:hypothetical protein
MDLGKVGTSLAALEFILYDKVSDTISACSYNDTNFKLNLKQSPKMIRTVGNKNVASREEFAEVPDPLLFYIDCDRHGDSVDLATC